MRNHKVRRGECLAKIASDFGFADYREIYNHPANTEFKKKRPNPFVIKAGDRIFIPDKPPPKVYLCETGCEHTFVMKRPSTQIILHVHRGDKPLASKDYILSVDNLQLNGTTDASGLVNQIVPAWATSAELYFLDDDFTFDIKLGDLDPLTEVSGIQQRLENLGYTADDQTGFTLEDESDEIGAATIEALRRFQVKQGLERTGEPDAPTIARLRAIHDKEVKS